MKREELQTLLSRKIDLQNKSTPNPTRGQERALVYPFDITNLSQVLRRLADELEREEKETGYSPSRIDITRDWTDRNRYRAEVVFKDRRWFV